MKVTYLNLTNLRSISSAEFRFKNGFNLIVGANGVGKSSVLDALALCLSANVNQANGLRTRAGRLVSNDIRVGASGLTVECGSKIGSMEHHYLIHRPGETGGPQQKEEGVTRRRGYATPARSSFLGEPPQVVTGREPEGRPLAVLFSTSRAVPSRRRPSERMAAGGTDVAFGDALVSRELRLSEIAAWMRAQESLRSERASATATLRVLEETVQLFLEGYTGLRGDDSQRELLIDRKGGTVAVMRMSDGERGTLALILDLTRRLVQANPEMDNPVVEAEAVVLIDELDLHLHPAWQRLIVHKLTSTFPRCQFIATTHSPQVIGEVEHDRIHIMTGGEVYPPSHSFGVDSSRVLDEIMDAERRTKIAQDLLAQMSATIGGQHYEAARRLLPRIVEVLGEADPEVTPN